MPPKPKFTREEIVAAALQVVRTRGLEALTTREIAAELGTSTRPIFTYFESMEQVRAEVRKAAEKIYLDTIEEGLSKPIPFLGVGQQYIRFARQEPQFYRMLFLLRAGLDENGVPSMLTHLTKLTCESVMKTYRVTQQQAERYTRDMWLVSHGIAALIVTNSCPYTDEQISRIFTGFSLSVYKSIKEIPGFAENDYDRDAEFRKLVEK